MVNLQRRANYVAITAVVMAGALSGCSGNLEEVEGPVLETLASKSETTATTTRAADRPVDPKDFERAGMSVFSYRIGEHSGVCAISPHGVTCQGQTPKDAPMVTAVPLPPRKADSIYAGEDGMHYTVFEGVGPAQGELLPGQSIRVNENFCHYPDDATLRCTSGDALSYTITDSEGAIHPSGQLDDPPVWTLPEYW
ncbi:hypothetical protein [Corynebacterium tuscaniense]|uniref:hypothetical protein n=1 Tax=Corynebacterium tuscaniense TaxID=302449 RepID=UPI00050E8B62|nr:hypothetical protein [Corynebacterium tuscaniense]KGF24565.1 hypothetical protein HMPREF2129_01615 [Corynebacterium tuscaniense DNF00037]